MYYDAANFLRLFAFAKPNSLAALLLGLSLAVAAPAGADRLMVENPGPILITFSLAEVRYGDGRDGASSAAFNFDSTRPEACRDGVNNDDRRAMGQGIQDTAVDHPADPDCVGPEDDSEDKPGLQPRQTLSLTGTIDSEGAFHIPMEGILIPPRYLQSTESGLGGDQVVVNTFEPTHDAVGHLDPFTGEMTLRLRYRMRFDVEGASSFSGPGDRCYLGTKSEPHDIVMRTGAAATMISTRGVGGVPYDWRDGSFSVAGTNVATVPRATCCGFFCFGDSLVSEPFGAPVEPGTMLLIGSGRVVPAPIPAVRAQHVLASNDNGPAGATGPAPGTDGSEQGRSAFEVSVSAQPAALGDYAAVD
jgi:hypothetical protein